MKKQKINENQALIVKKVKAQKCDFDAYEPLGYDTVIFVLKGRRQDDSDKEEKHIHVQYFEKTDYFNVTAHYVKSGGSMNSPVKEDELKSFFKRTSRKEILPKKS